MLPSKISELNFNNAEVALIIFSARGKVYEFASSRFLFPGRPITAYPNSVEQNIKTVEILFSQKLLLNIEDQTPVFCAGVLDSLAVELRGTKDFSKLNAGITILGYIASISDPVNTRAFSHLLSFLGHRYPKEEIHELLLSFAEAGIQDS